jgi:transcriptional regulator GlxA family with amidase domain
MEAYSSISKVVIVNKPKNKTLSLTEKNDQLQRELASFLRELPHAARLPRDIASILDFIHDHVFEPSFNVNSAKHGCRITNNNISTRFRVVLGLGIREYIESLRLYAASRLLRDRRFEIYLIAMAVGYEHQETFCRAFRRHFGYPPSGHSES